MSPQPVTEQLFHCRSITLLEVLFVYTGNKRGTKFSDVSSLLPVCLKKMLRLISALTEKALNKHPTATTRSVKSNKNMM